MKNFFRIISLMLALLMLTTSLVACTNNDDIGKESSNESDTVATPSDDPSVSKLPDMDWNGDLYTVLGREGLIQFTNFEIYYEELPADVVGQAVYKRNEALKDKYNFEVYQVLAEDTFGSAAVTYSSGDDLYNLVIYKPSEVQNHASQGYLQDLNTLNYINLENEAWSDYINDQLTIADKLYYTTNNFLLQDKSRAYYLFYNRELSADLGLGYLEDLVDSDQWTLEKATELSKAASADLDNNGPTYTDRFGYASENRGQFINILMSAGFRFTEKDANGYPKLVGATDKMLKIFDSTLAFTANKSISWCQELSGEIGNDDHHPEIMFLDNRVLLLCAFTTFIDYQYNRLDADLEFGILPNPKYDKSIKDYTSNSDISWGCVFAVPYTTDSDFAGFCLEAISEASTDTSYFEYIQTKCQYQDATDEDCARMMALCFNNQVYDVGAFLFTDSGELYYETFYKTQAAGVNLYKRTFDSCKQAAQIKLDELIAAYEDR